MVAGVIWKNKYSTWYETFGILAVRHTYYCLEQVKG